jgi:hypothetical protein
MERHRTSREAVCYLQDGSGALSDIRLRVVIPYALKLRTLHLVVQR